MTRRKNSKSENNDSTLLSLGATPTADLNRKVDELSEEVIRQRGVIATLTRRLSFVMSMLDMVEDTTPASVIEPGPENSGATANADTDDVDTITVTATEQMKPKQKPPDLFHNAVMSAVYVEQQLKQSRERNFVVSGLPDTPERDDKAVIEHLCSKELNIKPKIRSCLRLGKRMDGKVQPVLVSLHSTDQASLVIANAKKLRNSTDPQVKAEVYINADLTKAQSAAAYKIRCQRRKRAQAKQHVQSAQPGNSMFASEPVLENTLNFNPFNDEACPLAPGAADMLDS